MPPSPSKANAAGDPPEDLARLSPIELLHRLAAAATGTAGASLSELLRILNESVRGSGATLWELDPVSETLFVYESWFPEDGAFTYHNFSVRESQVGEAILAGHSRVVEDVRPFLQLDYIRDTRLAELIEHYGTRSFVVVPVQFLDGHRGAVTVSRRAGMPAFSEDEVARLQEQVNFLPFLYQAAAESSSRELLERVDETLRAGEVGAGGPRELDEVLEDLCRHVAAYFHCREVSIFLRSSLKGPEEYELRATTFEDHVPKKLYRPSAEDGATGWILERRQPVEIPDLGTYSRDRPILERRYPGLVWKDSLGIGKRARLDVEHRRGAEYKPKSFMGTPIVFSGEQLLGALRCCESVHAPFYFTDRQRRVLALVASQVGRFWHGVLRRDQIVDENRHWNRFIEGLSILNERARAEVEAVMPNVPLLLEESLRLLEATVSGADVLSVRLLDPDRRELRIAAARGSPWDQGTKAERQARMATRFPVGATEIADLGARVLERREQQLLQLDPETDRAELIDAPLRAHLATPLLAGRDVLGVLDLAGVRERGFSEKACLVARLLAGQIARHIRLFNSIAELRQASERERELHHSQALSTKTLFHQLKSPTANLRRTTELLMKARVAADPSFVGSPNHRLYRVVLGQSRRIGHVVASLATLGSLSLGEDLKLNRTALATEDLLRRLIRLADDAQALVAEDDGLRFHVDRDSFDVLEDLRCPADVDLLDQAVGNLLDNARKYSDRGSRVDIAGLRTRKDDFAITVTNVVTRCGHRIAPHETERLKGRGIQGDLVPESGAGYGMGLWIVDEIMKAHGGSLLLLPTRTPDGRKHALCNEIRLILPATPR